MKSRDITYILKRSSKSPVVVISGPQESGKTTLVKSVFKNHKYVSFEDADTRMFATNDPERFLTFYQNDWGIILDEVQLIPALFVHIQAMVQTWSMANKKRPGYFVLISSEKLSVESLQLFYRQNVHHPASSFAKGGH